MNISTVKIDTIVPYIRNPRKNDQAIDKVAGSIKEFGWKQPIVVDKDNVIIVGHTRYLAAQKLGIKEVPIIIAEDLNTQQIKAYRIADNKTAEFSSWNDEQLVLEIQELQDSDYNLQETGFTLDEIEDLNKSNSILDELLKDGVGLTGIVENETGFKSVSFPVNSEDYDNFVKPFINKNENDKFMIGENIVEYCKGELDK